MSECQYTYIDLFSGAGGMSLGFEMAGFKNILAVEIEEEFAKTYAANFPQNNLLTEDIRNLTDEKIASVLGNAQFPDIIIGGPPCQGFSIAGNIARNFIDDDRNSLFKEFVRIVNLLKPKMFMLENVAAMKNHNKGKTVEKIISDFSDLGYEVKYKVLNASSYSIAQERRRIFLVGTKGKNNFSFPQKSNKKVSVSSVISDLPKLKSGEKSDIPNHFAMNHSAQMLKKMSYVKDGGTREDIPESLRPKSGDIRKYIRYDSKKPSYCITGDMRKVFHYNQNRALTCRELARIQTFPDDFIFEGSSSSIQQQIGNAVPVRLAFLLAEKAKEVLASGAIS